VEQNKRDQHQSDGQAAAPATSVTSAPREETVPHGEEERVIDPDHADVEEMRANPRDPEPFSGSQH
jgi:hypothetical protein